jgi:hypothetical protein
MLERTFPGRPGGRSALDGTPHDIMDARESGWLGTHVQRKILHLGERFGGQVRTDDATRGNLRKGPVDVIQGASAATEERRQANRQAVWPGVLRGLPFKRRPVPPIRLDRLHQHIGCSRHTAKLDGTRAMKMWVNSNMTRAFFLILPMTFVLSGCPPPSSQLEAVDGLEGGALKTALSVPSLTVEENASADSVVANTIVGATSIESPSATFGAAAIGALSVDQPITTLQAGSLSASDVSAAAITAGELHSDRIVDSAVNFRPEATGRVILGRPVGIATRESGAGRGYREADERCAVTFSDPSDRTKPEAHVCTAYEVSLMAGRLELQNVDQRTLDGAAYNTFTVNQVGTRVLNDGVTTLPIMANDCAGWTRSGADQTTVPSEGFAEVTAIAAKHVLHVVDTFGNGLEYAVFPGTSADCDPTTMKWLCCQ